MQYGSFNNNQFPNNYNPRVNVQQQQHMVQQSQAVYAQQQARQRAQQTQAQQLHQAQQVAQVQQQQQLYGAHDAGSQGNPALDDEKMTELVYSMYNIDKRESALLELSKRREQYDNLALVLWNSFGTMAILLTEIIDVYPLLSPPALTASASNRVCNALALLQCVASHPETRSGFLAANLPLLLYPFLNTTSKTRPFEYLRLTSLGVIGALVKPAGTDPVNPADNAQVINFLLTTEIIPLCLRIMQHGTELSKTVAIFIVQKILLDEIGLTYICHTYERFHAVVNVLGLMVNDLTHTQAVRLLKHVVRCYLRLSDNPKAREALANTLPDALKNKQFDALLKSDMVTKRCLQSLLATVYPPKTPEP
ncbi:probable rcd1 protein involved in sexual development [Serendipita indica DSM 11827]|uniref:Probable rcd1 protein involved in sexual development n=1 Tax=Serendipita indica (strain DSM 11827) TaxID=1109443 RepID=G4T648_SERID|nr:probable rcd1 protein involved in sexual development [Serendipita indica DSM 11827]